MLASELAKKLLDHIIEYGDSDVEVRNSAGEFDIAEIVEKVNVSNRKGFCTWRIFLDC